MRWIYRSWIWPAGLMILAFWGLAACHRRKPPPPTSVERPIASAVPSSLAPQPELQPLPRVENVVLITVDALRADQPWTGYDQVSTPNLSRLAQESVVYTRAYSLANLTASSINGMLASRYPSELTRDTCALGRYEIEGSLAPTLQSASIETFAAHGHAIFAGDTAPKLGFDEWQLVRGSAGRLQKAGAVTGHDIAQLLLGHLERSRPKKKTFAWSHFVDPHHVYVAHAAHLPASREARSRYDSEVAYTDAVIGHVIKSIDRHGMATRTAIVLTSDHGEAFGEHGLMEHGFSLYEEEIRVPLMLRIPGVAPRRIEVPRSAIDLAPTMVQFCALPSSELQSFQGYSLLTLVTKGPGAAARYGYSESLYPSSLVGASGLFGIRTERYEYIRAPREELYDLDQDPLEKNNLVREKTAVAQELREALWHWMLEDTEMERRGEYLMPRPGRLAEARARGHGLRLEERLR